MDSESEWPARLGCDRHPVQGPAGRHSLCVRLSHRIGRHDFAERFYLMTFHPMVWRHYAVMLFVVEKSSIAPSGVTGVSDGLIVGCPIASVGECQDVFIEFEHHVKMLLWEKTARRCSELCSPGFLQRSCGSVGIQVFNCSLIG